jgi:hypothetical protein
VGDRRDVDARLLSIDADAQWHVGRSAGGGKQSSGEHELGDGASRLATFAAAALTACRCCLLCARQDCAASKKGRRPKPPSSCCNQQSPATRLCGFLVSFIFCFALFHQVMVLA